MKFCIVSQAAALRPLEPGGRDKSRPSQFDLLQPSAFGEDSPMLQNSKTPSSGSNGVP